MCSSHWSHTDPLSLRFLAPCFQELDTEHGSAVTLTNALADIRLIFQTWEIEKKCKQKTSDKHETFNTQRNMKYQLSDLNHISLLNMNVRDSNKNKHSSWLKPN